jgi:hypothetical protein
MPPPLLLLLLQAGRSLLLVGAGAHGLAPVRALLNWQPVLAHASSHPIAACLLTHCPGGAPFVAEWDTWREAGVRRRRDCCPGRGC